MRKEGGKPIIYCFEYYFIRKEKFLKPNQENREENLVFNLKQERVF